MCITASAARKLSEEAAATNVPGVQHLAREWIDGPFTAAVQDAAQKGETSVHLDFVTRSCFPDMLFYEIYVIDVRRILNEAGFMSFICGGKIIVSWNVNEN